MPLFMVEFRDGTDDGLSTVCQPVVTDTADHAADIAYRVAGHVASTGAARVISMRVVEAATAYAPAVVIDSPVPLNDWLSHVATWIDHHSGGTVEIADIEYPFDTAYAGVMHASTVARHALATLAGVR